jgi:hypothetical protein
MQGCLMMRAFALLFVLSGCATPARVASHDIPWRVTSLDGAAIFPAYFFERTMPPMAEGAWTPTEAEAIEADVKLAGYLQKRDRRQIAEHLSGYRRQYRGTTRKGRRVLDVNAFCVGDSSAGDWLLDWVDVFDGGECFFRATYDVERHEFTGLHIHGVA